MRAARFFALAAALLLCLLASRALAQAAKGDSEYEYGYNEAYEEGDDAIDEYNYYGNDDEEYYDYYGYYAEDELGYEDYYDEEDYEVLDDCTTDANGTVVLDNSTASCDVRIAGVDAQAGALPGGIDGVYKITGCHNGKPFYRRESSPAGEDRVLWFASIFGDWDVSKGTAPIGEILMYGGEIERAAVPMLVSDWVLSAELISNNTFAEDEFRPVDATVTCADGKAYVPPKGAAAAAAKQLPVLTSDEWEGKYKEIYERYGHRREPNPTVNFTFVLLLVMTGLTIVLALPYYLLKKKGGKGGSVAGGFAAMLQQSRKKATGHDK